MLTLCFYGSHATIMQNLSANIPRVLWDRRNEEEFKWNPIQLVNMITNTIQDFHLIRFIWLKDCEGWERVNPIESNDNTQSQLISRNTEK